MSQRRVVMSQHRVVMSQHRVVMSQCRVAMPLRRVDLTRCGLRVWVIMTQAGALRGDFQDFIGTVTLFIEMTYRSLFM